MVAIHDKFHSLISYYDENVYKDIDTRIIEGSMSEKLFGIERDN